MWRSVGEAYRQAFRGLPRAVWIASIVAFLNRAGTMVLPFLGLWLAEDRGLGTVAIGGLLAAWGAGSILGTWLGGWLSDRFGAQRLLATSLTGTALGFLALPHLGGTAALGAGLFVVAMLGDAFRPAIMSYVAIAAPPELATRAVALLRLFINVGMSFGPAVGGILAAIDYQWIFVVDAATCLAAAIVAGFALPAVERIERRPGPRPGRSPWHDRPVLVLFALSFVSALVFFQLLGAWPLYLGQVIRLSEPQIGLLLALNAAVVAVVELALVSRLAGLRQLRVAGLGSLLICFGFGATALAHGLPALAVTVLLWSVGEMLAMPITSGLVMSRAPRGRTGEWMGAYALNWSLAMLLAPLLGTWLWASFGAPVLWLSIGLLGPGLWAAHLALDRVWDAPPPAASTESSEEAERSRAQEGAEVSGRGGE